MKQLRRENGEDEVMQYSCIEEQMKGNSYEAVEKGNGEDEVMQYSCIEEQMKGNSYEAVEKGNGEDEVMQYSCIEEQMKETVMKQQRREMVKMKLCSTLVQRNR